LTPQQVAEAQAGLMYINIHSNVCPNGELRAQLDVLPNGFALAQLPGPLPIFGSVDQTVDPDNFLNPCVFPSRAQIRGTYGLSGATFSYDLTFGSNAPSFDDLKLFKGAPATLLHFHSQSPPGGAPRGMAAGNPFNVSSIKGSFLLNPAEIADLQAGMWYINIHSDYCPNGELRAQLDVKPAPLAPPLAAAAAPPLFAKPFAPLAPFALAAAAAPLGMPIFGDNSQTVDPDNFNNPCVVPSRAQLRGSFAIDVASGIFSYDVAFGSNAPSFDDGNLFFGGFATLFHFHGPAPRGQGVGVIFAVDPPVPGAGFFPLTPQQVAEAQAGLMYINIHSNVCPNGELRAQLDVLPNGFALAQLPGPLPIFGSVDQTVDPDNFLNPCVFASRAQIRGTYGLSGATFSYDLTFGSNAPSFDDLKLFNGAPATLLHFHSQSPPGGAPRGMAAGNPFNVSSIKGSFLLNPAEISDLQAGMWYINIHSDICPNGELRAQLDVKPAPLAPPLAAAAAPPPFAQPFAPLAAAAYLPPFAPLALAAAAAPPPFAPKPAFPPPPLAAAAAPPPFAPKPAFPPPPLAAAAAPPPFAPFARQATLDGDEDNEVAAVTEEITRAAEDAAKKEGMETQAEATEEAAKAAGMDAAEDNEP
jgi:hypothetical protein